MSTMYIFTPLNQICYKYLLKKPDNIQEEPHSPEINKLDRAETLIKKREKLQEVGKNSIFTIFKKIDEFILKPLLIRDYEKRYVVS